MDIANAGIGGHQVTRTEAYSLVIEEAKERLRLIDMRIQVLEDLRREETENVHDQKRERVDRYQ